MKHDLFELTVKLDVCDGMKGKVLDEIRAWKEYSLKQFDHAVEVKVYVNHKEIVE